MATHLISLRLTDTELQAVEELVTQGYFRSRSHLLRIALVEKLNAMKLKPAALQAIRVERLGVRERKRSSAGDRR